MKKVVQKTPDRMKRRMIILFTLFAILAGCLFTYFKSQKIINGALVENIQRQKINPLTIGFVIALVSGLVLGIVLLKKLENSDKNNDQGTMEFKTLLDSLPDATMIVDEHGLIKLTNKRLEYLFGYCKEELTNEFIELLIPCNYFIGSSTFWSDKDHYEYDMIVLNKDGDSFKIGICLSPIRIDNRLLTIARVGRLPYAAIMKNASNGKFHISIPAPLIANIK